MLMIGWMSRDTTLAHLAAGQHGVFTLEQAREIGIDGRLVFQRVRRGVYEAVAPGVYGIGGAPSSRSKDIVVAAMSIGPEAVASHGTAVDLWGIGPSCDRIHVVVRRWRRRRRTDFSVHESLDLEDSDRTVLNGIPVTTAVRSVIDIGATAPWLTERALDAGVRRGLFTVADAVRLVARVGRSGRRGVGVIRPLLDERLSWVGASESALEDSFRGIISKSGLPMPVSQYEVYDALGDFVCRADFAYPQDRLLIELDGSAYHTDRVDFQRDRSRQNRAALQGWRFLRYTWFDVTERRQVMVWQIRSALADETAFLASLDRTIATPGRQNGSGGALESSGVP
jgi:hypothetical protein